MMRLRFKVMYVSVTVLLLLTQSAFAFATASASAFSQRPLKQTASGYRNNSSGGLNNVSSNGNYWSSAANSATNAYNLNFNSGNVNPLDQYIKRELHVKHYGRYVDDGRIIHRDKAFLEDCIPAIAQFLHERLLLTLHPHKCTITSTFDDVFFLGAHCRPYRRYAANKTIASFHRAVHDMEFAFSGAYPLAADDFTAALSRINSYLGYFQHFNEFKMLDATLRGSSLNQVFCFAKDYRKALFRPEIKVQLQNNIYHA